MGRATGIRPGVEGGDKRGSCAPGLGPATLSPGTQVKGRQRQAAGPASLHVSVTAPHRSSGATSRSHCRVVK